MTISKQIILIEARFYEEISDQLAIGALDILNSKGFHVHRIQVPGILEIPLALQFAIESLDKESGLRRFSGGVVLGCAIKGETDHYTHVCNESIRGSHDVALAHAFPLGNGILTCPTRILAEERADPNKHNFGGRAAKACIDLIKISNEL